MTNRGYLAALEAAILAYQHEIVRFCTGMLGEDGEDVAHDVFLIAYAALPRFRGASSVRTWLFAIARNHCRKVLRDRTRRRRNERRQQEVTWGAHRDPPLPPGQETDDPQQLVLRFLQELPEPERAIVLMRSRQALSHAEIAQALHVSTRTVERKWAKALHYLGGRIKDAMGW